MSTNALFHTGPATVASPASTSAVDTGGSATTGRVELEAVLPPVLVGVALIVVVVFIAVVIVRVSRKRKSAPAAVAAVSTVSTTGDLDKLQSPPPLPGIWSDNYTYFSLVRTRVYTYIHTFQYYSFCF